MKWLQVTRTLNKKEFEYIDDHQIRSGADEQGKFIQVSAGSESAIQHLLKTFGLTEADVRGTNVNIPYTD